MGNRLGSFLRHEYFPQQFLARLSDFVENPTTYMHVAIVAYSITRSNCEADSLRTIFSL